MTLAGGYVQRRTAIQIDAIDVSALVEHVLNSTDVPSAGQEQQVHGGVQILRHGEFGVVFAGAAPNRVERGLPAEAEAQVVPPGVQRRLPGELATQVAPQRPRRELPRNPSLQLRRDVLH